MSKVAVFIFVFLIVDVLGSDFDISCYQMGDENYYGSVRKSEINCFTLPVHLHKINFTITAPNETLALSFKVCNVAEGPLHRIEPNTRRTLTIDSEDPILKEQCEERSRTDEIDVHVRLLHSSSTNFSDSTPFAFQIINNNKIGKLTNAFLTMAIVTGVMIYMLIILFAAVFVCPPSEQDTPRQDETEMDDLKRPDETEMDDLNRLDGTEMDNLNRLDEREMDNRNRPDGTEMDNLNRQDETEMDNLNRPDGTEMDNLNRQDETEMDNLNRPDGTEMDNLNRPEGTEMDKIKKRWTI